MTAWLASLCRAGRIALASVASCLLALTSATAAQEPDGTPTAPLRREPWSPRVLELSGSLAVQEGGRVKPLATFAAFTLLRLNGKRSMDTPSGEHLDPVAWLLDVLYYPEDAEHQEVFLVQNAEVVAALGLTTEEKHKRDRYSFAELRPGVPRLFALAHDLSSREARDLGPVDQQLLHLAENVDSFLALDRWQGLALAPPPGSALEEPEWLTLGELARRSEASPTLPESSAALLADFTELDGARGDAVAFETALGAFQRGSVALAEARGEYSRVRLELRYYSLGLLTFSLTAFVLAFLGTAFMWLAPQSRVVYAGTAACAVTGTLLVVAAIVMRCLIRGRPPVSTLYETVLFVTAVGSLVALATEAIGRRRVALSAAAMLGMVGLFVANGYEMLDKKDTMPSLVAVLDTNFWLATHVTSITVGYSAGLLAALLASIYLVGKALGWKRGERSFYAHLGRMVYGVLCFGLIFSTVGTILGGIWANESWGRFWGWDPKENGALLIVLTQIVILHGRLSGFLREHGVCMAAACGGMVVAFSWWGVNLLGVGLHSYGFTSGIQRALSTYYGIQGAVVVAGALAWLAERRRARDARSGAPIALLATERPKERKKSA